MTHPASELLLQCLSRAEPLIGMGEYKSRKWVQVALQCLSGSKLLTQIGECTSSKYVIIVFEQIGTIDENEWTPIQRVSLSYVWADPSQNPWQKWVKIQAVSASLPI